MDEAESSSESSNPVKVVTHKFLAVYLMCLVFPFGVWLTMLGYELWGLCAMFIGSVPPAYYFAMIFGTEITDEIP